jgi:hypothetical protein
MNLDNINKIKTEAPNAWADFNRFCKEKYSSLFSNYPTLKIEDLPFDMLLGVFQSYLVDSASAELDLGNLSYDQLEIDVVEAFLVHEVIMRHYS